MGNETKTLYHSELVKAGDVEVTVESDLEESKYKRGSYYVVLYFENRKRTYNPENRRCEQFFDGRKGETLTIRAVGRDDDADIELIQEGRSSGRRDDRKEEPRREERRETRREEPRREEPRREERSRDDRRDERNAPPVLTPDKKYRVAKGHLMKFAALYHECFKAAAAIDDHEVKLKLIEPRKVNELDDVATTIFIQAVRERIHDMMPWNFDGPKDSAPPREPERTREEPTRREPAPEPPPPDAPADDLPF